MDLKQRARRIKTDLPLVFLCLKNAQTPLAAKLFAAAAVAYALSPVDLIPDFVPVLGYLDDVLILPFLIAMSIWLIPPQVLERNRSRAQEIWKDGKLKRWYYAIGIIAGSALGSFRLLKKGLRKPHLLKKVDENFRLQLSILTAARTAAIKKEGLPMG